MLCCGTVPENWEGSGGKARRSDPDRSLFTGQDFLLVFLQYFACFFSSFSLLAFEARRARATQLDRNKNSLLFSNYDFGFFVIFEFVIMLNIDLSRNFKIEFNRHVNQVTLFQIRAVIRPPCLSTMQCSGSMSSLVLNHTSPWTRPLSKGIINQKNIKNTPKSD